MSACARRRRDIHARAHVRRSSKQWQSLCTLACSCRHRRRSRASSGAQQPGTCRPNAPLCTGRTQPPRCTSRPAERQRCGTCGATERGVRLAAAAAWQRLSTRLQYEVTYERSLTCRTPRSLSLATTPRACPHLESTTTTLDMLATSTSSAATASSSGNRTAVLLASSGGSSSTLSSLTCDGASTARCTPVALLRFCCACVMLRRVQQRQSARAAWHQAASGGDAHIERFEREPHGGHGWRQRQQALAAVVRVGALAAWACRALPFRERRGAGELQALVHGPGLPTWAARAKRVHATGWDGERATVRTRDVIITRRARVCKRGGD